MEINEAERIVIAKPVPSKPTCTAFSPFSDLLADAINASPSNVLCPETPVVAIRPKTMRFRPTPNTSPLVQPELSKTAATISNVSEKFMEKDSKSTVVYKPLAKVVSQSTISLLTNMGNFDSTVHQHVQQPVQAHIQHTNQEDNQTFVSQFSSSIGYSKMALSQSAEDDPKTVPPVVAADRPSYDGYNWRKYGQKQVKGSEYPRSYYKCTHPNCPVKKKVERSFDGQIAEIVYKGEHNHPKPQPPKRSSSGQGLVSNDGVARDSNNLLCNNDGNKNHLSGKNEGSNGRIENQNDVGVMRHSGGKSSLPYDHVVATGRNIPQGGCSENSCGLSGECEGRRKRLMSEDGEEPRNKRRKSEIQPNDAGISGDSIQEPRIVVQNSTDSEILGDGFRWRKYGQKVVKGNPYPRSYYRCTNLKCNVRKHVERASDDPKAFITTYEGKHNHDMPPLRNTNPGPSGPCSLAATTKDKP